MVHTSRPNLVSFSLIKECPHAINLYARGLDHLGISIPSVFTDQFDFDVG